MYFSSKKTKQITTVLIGIPLAFLLTQCAESFDKPPETVKAKVAEEIASGLNKPFDIAIVPESGAAAAPGKALNHNDLLVVNFGDNSIVQIDESTEPATVRPFADSSDTAFLKQPTGIVFDPNNVNGDIYVSNFLDEDGVTTGGAITVFAKDGTFLREINDPLFKGARGIAYDLGHSTATQSIFFVSNMGTSTIVKVVVTAATDTVTPYADLSFLGLGGANPTQLAVSPLEPHNLYAANTGIRPPLADGDAQAPIGTTMTIISTTTTSTLPLGSLTDIRIIEAGEVSGPLPLGFDDEGRLFTSDHAKGTVVMIDPQIGFKLAGVETGEANMYGMAVGEGGVYLTAVSGGRIIEVTKSLLTGAEGGSGHHE